MNPPAYLISRGALCIIAVLAVASFSARLSGAILYEDTFTGTSGTSVIGASPGIINTDSAVYQSSGSGLQYNGSGQVVTTVGSGALNLALPTIVAGDILTLTLDLRSAASGASAYTALGFTNAVGTLSSATTSEIMASVRADSAGRVFLGSPGGTALYLGAAAVTGSTATNVTTLTRLVMTFDTGTQNLSVTATNLSNNAIVTFYNQSISYSTLDELKFATFQFASENISTSGNPAFVDYFKVELTSVPEPASFAMLAGLGVLGLAVNRRSRRA